MQRRLGENPPDGDLEGHFFEPFPPSIRKRSQNIPSLPFLLDFSIILALPGDVHKPSRKKRKEKKRQNNPDSLDFRDTLFRASGQNMTLKVGQ